MNFDFDEHRKSLAVLELLFNELVNTRQESFDMLGMDNDPFKEIRITTEHNYGHTYLNDFFGQYKWDIKLMFDTAANPVLNQYNFRNHEDCKLDKRSIQENTKKGLARFLKLAKDI